MRWVLIGLLACGGDGGVPEPVDLGPVAGPPLDRASFCVEPVTEPLDTWFAAAAELGVGTVGVNEVNWDRFEPSAPVGGVPSYDPAAWALFEAVVLEAEERGLRLQLTLQVRSPWGTASTASGVGAPGSSPVLPDALPAYERWLADVLGAAAGTDPIWMLGNELEAPGHWNGSAALPADAAAYQDLMAVSAPVARSVAPTATLWRASTNFGPLFDDGPDPDTVEERLADGLTPDGRALLDAGLAGGPFEAFSLHPNHGPEGLWHQAIWVRARVGPEVGLVAEDLRSVRVDGLEASWPDEDGDGVPDIVDAVSSGDPVAVATWRAAQVDTLSQKLALGAAAGLEVLCVSTLMDFPADYPIPEWRNTGLVDDSGRRRPAAEAYRLWIEGLVGATPHDPWVAGDTGAWVVPFDGADGPLAIAWGSGSWSPPPRWGPVREVLRPPTADGENDWQPQAFDEAIPLSSTPVLIRF